MFKNKKEKHKEYEKCHSCGKKKPVYGTFFWVSICEDCYLKLRFLFKEE